jgi:hypothetical protein
VDDSVFYFRDLAIFRAARRRYLVAACDAVGGLGNKPEDVVQIDPECVGYFCARVVLLELLSVQVRPRLAACTFSVEMHPTGQLLLSGVQRQFKEENLLDQVSIIDSTETNFTTRHTAMGMTLIGDIRSAHTVRTNVQVDDIVYRVGVPRVGLHLGDADLLPVNVVRALAVSRSVHEVIPLGSRGVAAELRDLRKRGVDVELFADLDRAELSRSGGPANAVLVVAGQDGRYLSELTGLCAGQMVARVGTVISVGR